MSVCIHGECGRPQSPNAMHAGCFFHEVEASLDMANGCLAMVHEALEQIMGEGSMDATPPMFYPEAIITACARAAKVGATTGNPTPPLPLNPDGYRTGEEGPMSRSTKIPDRIWVSKDRQWAKSRTPVCTEEYVRAPTEAGEGEVV